MSLVDVSQDCKNCICTMREFTVRRNVDTFFYKLQDSKPSKLQSFCTLSRHYYGRNSDGLGCSYTPNSFPTQRQFSSILTANYHTINAKYHYSMKVHCLRDNNQTFYKILYTLCSCIKCPQKVKTLSQT